MSEWYYAKGGKQHGPIGLEQLRDLARDGGLDPEADLVWNSGMKDWLPAGRLEVLFPGAPASEVPPPPLDPENSLRGLVQASGSAQPIVAGAWGGPQSEGGEPIGPVECIKRGFDLTVQNFGPLLVVVLVYFGIMMALSVLVSVIDGAIGAALRELAGQDGRTIHSVVSMALNLALQVPTVFLNLGLLRVSLNLVDGRPFEVAQLFGEGKRFLNALLASILFGVALVVGLLLLVIPGIYIGLRFGQYLYAIVDHDKGVVESFEHSSRITNGNLWRLIGLWFLTVLLSIAALIPCGLGFIFVGPLICVAWAVAYRWMDRGRQAACGA